MSDQKKKGAKKGATKKKEGKWKPPNGWERVLTTFRERLGKTKPPEVTPLEVTPHGNTDYREMVFSFDPARYGHDPAAAFDTFVASLQDVKVGFNYMQIAFDLFNYAALEARFDHEYFRLAMENTFRSTETSAASRRALTDELIKRIAVRAFELRIGCHSRQDARHDRFLDRRYSPFTRPDPDSYYQYREIGERAVLEGTEQFIAAIVELCHLGSYPLDLPYLCFRTSDQQFESQIRGIMDNMDTRTGQMMNGYIPPCSEVVRRVVRKLNARP